MADEGTKQEKPVEATSKQEEAKPKQEKPVEAAPKIEDDVEVYPLNYVADQRRELTVIVSSDHKRAWLMPSVDVPGNITFRILLTDAAKLAKPYGFDSEIKELLPSIQDVKYALWRKGVVSKDDMRRVADVRNALATVALSANQFVQFLKGDN